MHAVLLNNQTHPYRKRFKPSRHQISILEEDSRWLLESFLDSVTRIHKYTLSNLQLLHMEEPIQDACWHGEKHSWDHGDICYFSIVHLLLTIRQADHEGGDMDIELEASEDLQYLWPQVIRPLLHIAQQ